MLKKITTAELAVGMYIADLGIDWIDSPFWKSAFPVSDAQMLNRIRALSQSEVWIDTDRGHDLPAGGAAAVKASAVAEGVAGQPGCDVCEGIVLGASAALNSDPAGIADELDRAKAIVREARKAVGSMFQEARLGRAVQTADARMIVDEIAASIMRNPNALLGLARIKTIDDYTYMHSVAVCTLMVSLARQLGFDDGAVREAGLAGLLHDVGKMAIDPEILQKQGRLTDTEFEAIKAHPAAGLQMLARDEDLSEAVRDVCLHHHEKMDGTGYPHRLAGAQISLLARMGAVCDVYDAITSQRPYKTAWCPAESLQKMAQWTPSHFDPTVFHAFVKSVGIYPVGTLVRLASGLLGVVTEQRCDRPGTQPVVNVFFSSKSMQVIPARTIDLSRPDAGDRIVTREDPAKWHFTDLDRYWLGG